MRVERSGPMIRPRRLANHWREEPVSEAKPFNIPKQLVAAHTDNPWVRLYIGRWLRAAAVLPDGTTQPRGPRARRKAE